MKHAGFLLLATLLVAGVASAALTNADLTPQAIVQAIKAKPAAQRTAYAKQVLEAIAARPADDASKVQALTTASRALLTGAGSISMIAEIFNTIPVEHLQGVAQLLATENFDQKANGMTDAQYDEFCEKVVSSASRYIEASGSDSPAVRMSILTATFTRASSDPDRTRQRLVAALPTAVQAAAATYIAASEAGNREVIAAAAGVDEVTETPKDPDSSHVVPAAAATATAVAVASAASENTATASEAGAPATAEATAPASDASAPATAEATTPAPVQAKDDYLEPNPPPASSDAESKEVEVKVPLLSRFTNDVLGITLDTMEASMYDWQPGSFLPATFSPTKAADNLTGIDEGTLDNQPDYLPLNPKQRKDDIDRNPSPSPSPSPVYGNQSLT